MKNIIEELLDGFISALVCVLVAPLFIAMWATIGILWMVDSVLGD